MSAVAQQPGPPQKRQRGGPGPNAPAAGADAETAKRGLISVNNLRYELPPDLSVVVSRSMHPHYFHTTEYTPGQRMVCQLNSGSSYIDGQNSYLTFDLETKHSADQSVNVIEAYIPTFGKGSATSLFQNVSIIARSGDEIERTENLWSIMPEQDRMHRPKEWFRSVGELMGYDPDQVRNDIERVGGDALAPVNVLADASGGRAHAEGNVIGPPFAGGSVSQLLDNVVSGGVPDLTNTKTTRYVIPLTSLSQFFRTTDKLVPAALASGLRFEFQLAANNLPWAWSKQDDPRQHNAPTEQSNLTWKIKNPRVMCDSYQLTDSIQRAMNETIASSGVELPFIASHYSGYSVAAGQTSANLEIRKAVSRALTLVHKVVDEDSQTNSRKDAHDTVQAVAFDGKGGDITEYQVRVGSLYFPHQKLKAPTSSLLLKELYHHTLRGGSSAFKRPQNPGSVDWRAFRSNACTVWTDLERSSAQNLTGIPINNSRVIELALQTGSSAALASKQIQVFLFYVRLVRVFLNNVEVEE